MTPVLLETAAPASYIDWSSALTGVDFSAVFAGIADIIKIIAVPVISFIGVRKGWSFLKSQLRGA